ncbi:MAG: hypothetical protein WDZ37_02905 [Solirubrobacterales bacterium]
MLTAALMAAAATAAIAAPAADAATTIGSNLASAPTSSSACAGAPTTCAFFQTALSGSAFRSGAGGATAGQFSPPLTDTSSGAALAGPNDLEFLVNADVEPDADGDGYGDETQDLCPGDSSRHDSCFADLQVTTTASVPGIGLLTDMTFFVKVRNTGPQNKATGVTMTDAIPALMRIDTVKTDAGTCTPTQTVTCSLGDIAVNTTATIRIDVTGVKRGPVHAVASATASSPDPNGANNVASADTAVLNPGACANTFKGGGGPDSITGTAAGDTLVGDGGDDTLRAAAGYDCLEGGGGNDRLYGESADDRLFGGAGNDHLDGGTEEDTFSAGPGNDVVESRDKIAEKVNCGKGRDRAIADRKDKLTGCESGGSKKKKKKKRKRH